MCLSERFKENIDRTILERFAQTVRACVIAGALVVLATEVCAATPGYISTVAGVSGQFGYSGDGAVATSASLWMSFQSGIAADTAGNLYIADSDNNVVRKVGTNGIISTVAGNGSQEQSGSGGTGDGGAATSAELSAPYAVAVDSVGNLYIADKNRIRKVGSNGIINTVAGSGTEGFSGDGGAATSAELNAPLGMAIDNAGNLYISDSINNRVRKVDTNGIITTVAGRGPGGYRGDGGAAINADLNQPQGLAVDSTGNLFIVDSNNNVIRKVDTNGIISTVAGNGSFGYTGDGGAATAAELEFEGYWTGLAVDSAGNLFVSEVSSIRKIGTNGLITTVAGNRTYGDTGDGGPATSAELYAVTGVAIDGAGNLYFADTTDNVVREVALIDSLPPPAYSATASGSDTALTLEANINVAPADQGTSGNMYVVAILPGGQLFVLSSTNGWVPYNGTIFAAIPNVTLSAKNSVPIIGTPLNVTGLIGTVLFAGYGSDVTHLLNNGTYAAVYAIH